MVSVNGNKAVLKEVYNYRWAVRVRLDGDTDDSIVTAKDISNCWHETL